MNTSIIRRYRSPAVTRAVVALLLPLAIAAAGPDCAHAGRLTLAVEDAFILEGNDGVQYAEVAVNLSKSHNKPITVNYRTADGTATAGADYDAVAGTLTFAKGQTSKTILVPVHGDRAGEPDEYLLVELSNPTRGAKVDNNTSVVLIWDDEPRISIGYAYEYEGDTDTKPFTFTVSLWPAYDEEVTVNFDTQDYSAFAGTDYVATSGTVTFVPGDTTETITVDVNGDTTPEPGENFLVVLDNASSNALISYDQGWGTIWDDDGYYYYYYYYYGWGGYYYWGGWYGYYYWGGWYGYGWY